MIKQIFIKVLFFVSLSFFSQSILINEKITISQLFDKVEQYYVDKNNYGYVINYNYYPTNESKKPIDQYDGLVLKKENVKYQKIENTEFIDFGDKNVMINHSEKIIQISDVENTNSPTLIKSFLTLFPIHSIKETESKYVCELSVKKINQTNINKIVIIINKNDFSIQKQTFHFLGQTEREIDKKTIKLNNPKLEVLFTEKKEMSLKDLESLKKTNYYQIKNNKIISSEKYKSYKLIVY